MTDCTAPRHDDDPAEAEAHAYLCRPCRTALRRDLLRLPALHTDLRSMLATAKSGHGDGSGLPFNDPASECANQIRHDLTWWARHITKLRGEAAPPVHAAAADWLTNPVKVMAHWLAGQISAGPHRPGWIPQQPWAGDIADAIHDDHNRATALLQPRVVKRITWIATCEHCQTLRELQAIVYATEGDRRTSYIECLTCHARWEFGPDWLRMAANADRITRHQQVA
jgi:hypothetical protein